MRPVRQSYNPFLFLICYATICLASCRSLPQPFEREESNNPIIEKILASPSVMITPIVNAPPPINFQLAQQVATEAQRRQIAAVTRGASRKANLLQGTASTHRNESGDILIRIDWKLAGADGILIDQTAMETEAFEPTADDPWLLYANSNFTKIVDQTGAFLEEAFFGRESEEPRVTEGFEAEPDFQNPYHLYVRDVMGAPGDGSQSLTNAMNELLGTEEIPLPLVVDPVPGDLSFVIAGRVELRKLDESAEAITFIWDLMLPSEEILGSVKQENVIPQGSLDGEWGEVAFEVAAAAADGLMSVLLQMDPLTTETLAEPKFGSAP